MHTELRPENYRKPVANLAIITDSAEDQNNNNKWEVEQLAREQRSKRYALEKNLDDTETEEQQDDENAEQYQFMADFNTPPPKQDRDEQLAEDEEQYRDSMRTMRMAAYTTETEARRNGKEQNSAIIINMHVTINFTGFPFSYSDHESTPAVLRSTTSPRRFARIPAVLTVHFKPPPRPVIQRATYRPPTVRRLSSPPPRVAEPVVEEERRTRLAQPGGEMYMDPDDPIQIPLTFPIQDVGEPTPSTTNLEEPPSELAHSPSAPENSWPSTGWTTPEPASPESSPSPDFSPWITAHHMKNSVWKSIDIVKSAQQKLDKFIYAKIQEGEAVVPLQVVIVQKQDVDTN